MFVNILFHDVFFFNYVTGVLVLEGSNTATVG